MNMKTWRIVSIAAGAVALGVIITLVCLFAGNAGAAAQETQPATTATAPTQTMAQETTEATTQPEETTAAEETTAPEETTLAEETTVPETTVAPTTTPPETTAPPETTKPPETTQPTEPVTSDSSISINAHHAFVYDVSTGTYLYNKGVLSDHLPPASMTKLFTAYVALQYLPVDTVITAGEEVSWIDPESSVAHIYWGQSVTVGTCVQGLIMVSGNDAAYILAVNAGKVILNDPAADTRAAFDAFITEMNIQAQNLGLWGTHFANPDGIDDPEHYISPRDMCTIAQLALNNEVISRYAATCRETVNYVSGQSITWTNSNYLLHEEGQYYCPEAIGLKTGHTSEAGDCLVSAFRLGERTLIICVYGCTENTVRYEDTLTLFELFR